MAVMANPWRGGQFLARRGLDRDARRMPITVEGVARSVKKCSKTLHLRRNAARVMSHTRADEACIALYWWCGMLGLWRYRKSEHCIAVYWYSRRGQRCSRREDRRCLVL